MSQVGDFYDIYKLNGLTESKKDFFESITETPQGKLYIKNSYEINVTDNQQIYIKGIILNVTEECKTKETTRKLTTSLKVGNISNWEYDVEQDQVWISKHIADIMQIPGSNINGVILNKEQYCKLYENMTFTTKDGLKTFEDYDFNFLKMWSIDDTSLLKDTYKVEFYNKFMDRTLINTAKPIIEDGKLIKFIGSTKDITIERDREKELIHAKDIAEEATAQQTRFVANMSHSIQRK